MYVRGVRLSVPLYLSKEVGGSQSIYRLGYDKMARVDFRLKNISTLPLPDLPWALLGSYSMDTTCLFCGHRAAEV
jgi:hypothetical protein